MNLVVETSKWRPRDLVNLFGDEEVIMVPDMDLSNLAVQIGAYDSTSKARKAGRVGPIPSGWTEWKASKKIMVWIWNPSE